MYQLNSSKQSSPRRRFFIAAAVVLAVLVVGFVGTKIVRRHRVASSPVNVAPTQSPESIQADKKAGDDIKGTLAPPATEPSKTDPTPTPPATGKKTVTPIITSSTDKEVRAFVPGFVEGGGTCTLTLTKAGQTTVTKTQPATANATTTDCPTFNLGASYSGWTAQVSYSSANAQGTSETRGL